LSERVAAVFLWWRRDEPSTPPLRDFLNEKRSHYAALPSGSWSRRLSGQYSDKLTFTYP
jgi:hypothetical protein